ncbi:TetR family transcriptional regulator [Salinibacterium sp. UTAS2018]|uniref:TetR family transcriptional regulator n=1 Tax=Salinibacterium sp. UTAS2018 TaxID=2508880 RepID=UPI0010098365|nr:TetR family transcriptional regulator [Salinibacterium sp. UTAS2018]QAV69269.1 TetR family transcriptional regulator [Salinibacterium sp. UTAS2018]
MDSPPPTLTERRKLDTQLEVARTAARLFAERGAHAVTAEQIAQESGIAVRTFYRYFSSKEDAVAPLLTVGAGHWRALLAAAQPQEDVVTALERTIRQVLTATADADRETMRWTLGLLRAADDDKDLRDVWYRVNGESEAQLRTVIATLVGPDTDPFTVRIVAAAATQALRVALEMSAADSENATVAEPAQLAARALRTLTHGIQLEVVEVTNP